MNLLVGKHQIWELDNENFSCQHWRVKMRAFSSMLGIYLILASMKRLSLYLNGPESQLQHLFQLLWTCMQLAWRYWIILVCVFHFYARKNARKLDQQENYSSHFHFLQSKDLLGKTLLSWNAYYIIFVFFNSFVHCGLTFLFVLGDPFIVDIILAKVPK